MTIVSRLIVSFVLMIAIFTIYVVITNIFYARIDQLSRHNNDYVRARGEIVLMYHHEFTEMRRLLHESFLSGRLILTRSKQTLISLN